MNKIIPGQEIEAQIVAITKDCVFIDLNAKSEGIIDKAEFLDNRFLLNIPLLYKIYSQVL